MVQANKVVSTGRRINDLSDDPVGLVNVLDLRASLDNINQLEKNIGTGKSWLTSGETALTQVNDILTQVKTLCVEMASATKGASERANAAGIVDGLTRQILALANTQVGGRYIFSGTETDQIPFSFDDDNNPTQVDYYGNDTPFSIKIGKDINVAVGRDGQEIFGQNWDDKNIFKNLMDLKDHLQSNDLDGINQIIGRLDIQFEGVQDIISDTGTKVIRLDVKQAIISDLQITYTEQKSLLEDADIAEAVMNLTARELAYKAALSSSSKVMNLSLVDYL
jgi:flagellar hook-associated protein 3 FlgL